MRVRDLREDSQLGGRTRREIPAFREGAKTPDVVGPSKNLTETVDTILRIVELFLGQNA